MKKVTIKSNSIVSVDYTPEDINDKITNHSFDLCEVSYMKCEEIIEFFVTVILKSGVVVKFHLDEHKDYKKIFSQWTTVKLEENKK